MDERRTALRTSAAHLLVEPDQLESTSFHPDDDVDHHLRRVLRLSDGDEVTVTDGSGRWRTATMRGGRSHTVVEATGPLHVESPANTPLTIAAAIPKGDRLNWMVQKVTELGADRLVLLHTERAVVRWSPDRVDAQLDRIRRVSDAALRQSRRVRRLEVTGPTAAMEVLPDAAVAEPGGRPLTRHDRTVAIGPEGGWSPAELKVARDVVDLGPNVLRTETAAVAAATLCTALSVVRNH